MTFLPRAGYRSLAAVLISLIVCERSGAQIAEAYEKEAAQDIGYLADYYISQSRANYIRSEAPGHLGLDGAGSIVGIGDSAYLGETHIDMRGRHAVLDRGISNNDYPSNHGNHTSGTVGGNGNRHPRFAGVAPAATLYSANMESSWKIGLTQLEPPHIFSNSWNTSDPVYTDWYEQKGRYNIKSQEIDALCLDHPDKLFVFSSGNSGGTQDGYPDNYLLVNPSFGAAKNTLVVGRLGDTAEYSFVSPFGPTRDGRIKPDLVATNKIIAPVDNHAYDRKDGSSMSTPLVAGVAALISQHYRNRNDGRNPDAGLLKAILMNSADNLGSQGPTFAGGFGAVNARRAAAVVTNRQFYTGDVSEGQRETFQIVVPEEIDGKAIAGLKVMLYWHDAAAEPYAASALVNNLDLTVDNQSTQHLPWVLDTTPSAVDHPATRGVDNLNNVEQVTIDAPAAGVYEAAVTAQRTPDSPVVYHVVYSLVFDELELTFPIGGEKLFSGQTRHVLWDLPHLYPDGDAVNDSPRAIDAAEYSTDNGATWTALEYDPTQVYQNPATHRVWQIPSLALTSAMVRLRQDERTSVSQPFTISQPLALTIQAGSTEQITLTWNSIDGADRYEVLHLVGSSDWQVLRRTAQTSAATTYGELDQREVWYSVRAVSADRNLQSQRAVAQRHVWTNTPPLAGDDYATEEMAGNVLFMDVLANDVDADGDFLQVVSVDSSEVADVDLMDNHTIRYWPNARFAGVDTIAYRITDNRGGFSVGRIYIDDEERWPTAAVEAEEANAIPADFALAQNYPNPFNPETVITFDLATSTAVTLEVYDVIGQRIATLVDEVRAAGRHAVGWRGINELGQPAVSGIYFCRLSYLDGGTRRQLSNKMVLLR